MTRTGIPEPDCTTHKVFLVEGYEVFECRDDKTAAYLCKIIVSVKDRKQFW